MDQVAEFSGESGFNCGVRFDNSEIGCTSVNSWRSHRGNDLAGNDSGHWTRLEAEECGVAVRAGLAGGRSGWPRLNSEKRLCVTGAGPYGSQGAGVDFLSARASFSSPFSIF